jgi:hypothetical protein
MRLLNGISCICQPGFYDDGTTTQCAKCDQSCGGCTGESKFNCSKCNAADSRELVGT